METRPSAAKPGGRKTESGAVLVETQIVFVLLFLIVSGILEYASVFATTIDTSSAVRSGARSGSKVYPLGANDDGQIVQSVLQKAGSKRSGITKIVVYKADPKSPGTECATLTSSDPVKKCNVYNSGDLSKAPDAIAALPNSLGWPPASRQPGKDYVGVYVEATRTPMFKNVGSPLVVRDDFAMKMTEVASFEPAGPWKPVGDGKDGGWKSPDWTCWDSRGCYDASGQIDGNSGDTGGSG